MRLIINGINPYQPSKTSFIFAMQYLELEALDTLFFRDGKPFSMGDETVAGGIFPPYPSVVSGSLRSQWFAENFEQFPKAGAPDDPSLALEIKRFHLQLEGLFAFPIPCDLYTFGEEKKAHRLHFEPKDPALISTYPFSHLLLTRHEDKIKEPAGAAFLTLANFKKYLHEPDTQCFGYKKLADYSTPEPKIGIGRDRNTNTAKEGLLYQVQMRRPEGKKDPEGKRRRLRLVVGYDGREMAAASGLLRIGAESKAMAFRQIAEPPQVELPEIQGDVFKIYFATPAVFADGWLPGSLFDGKLDILAAAIGRPVSIGGFDLQKNGGKGFPKPMLKAVPAGSVFYVRSTDPDATQKWIKTLHGHSVYDLDQAAVPMFADYRRQGFGLTFIGKVDKD